jgi:hypothetical protein
MLKAATCLWLGCWLRVSQCACTSTLIPCKWEACIATCPPPSGPPGVPQRATSVVYAFTWSVASRGVCRANCQVLRAFGVSRKPLVPQTTVGGLRHAEAAPYLHPGSTAQVKTCVGYIDIFLRLRTLTGTPDMLRLCMREPVGGTYRPDVKLFQGMGAPAQTPGFPRPKR